MSGAVLYTQGYGSRPENVELPHIDVRSPNSLDRTYPIGKRWINSVSNTVFTLMSFTYTNTVPTANWVTISGFGVSAVGQAVLVAGTVTVMNSACLATSLVFIVYSGFSGSLGLVAVAPSSIQNGQFTIGSSNGGDTSPFYYFIVN